MSGCRFIIVFILKEAIESWVGGFQRASRPLRTWGSKETRQAVDEIGGELLSFDGEMRIETGGRRRAVTEVLLNETKVDAGLQ